MTARLAVYYSPLALRHDTGSGVFEAAASPLLCIAEPHPENAQRLENMVSILRKGPISDRLDWREAPPAELEALLRFHDAAYLESLRAIPAGESRRVTSTTVFGPGSWASISAAAGQAIAAVDHVWRGAGKLAYALVRPPGHHAQPTTADGYCFLNNIGVAIEAARARGLRRAAVIDWDVHHGNGTQEGFYADPDVFTVSFHMDHGAWGPAHLQTGAPEEAGRGAGRGANLNVALPFGSGDAAYHAAFDRLVAPALEAFGPELLVVAAGQDANQFDPNGRNCVTMAGFHGLAARSRALAERCCAGRMALVQEGGYAISYAALCLHATLEGALGEAMSLPDPLAYLPDPGDRVDALIDGIERRWRAALRAA
ncbi:MAG: histone deacetylase [Myxococcales bacterium]|nr:histone deacetylase [Myxococcales bacterium]MDH5306814.1 histone deacetylase [Myxococcales bacterium]MDH5567663.1 histone deacetylase [Myxococcales bacterium]